MPLEFQKCFVLFQTKRTNSYIIRSVSSKSVADAILAEQEKELPADHPYPLVLVRHVTETDNLHTSNTTQVHN